MNKRAPSIIPADYSHSLNYFVYDEIPEKTRVLDVGCWNGNLGKKLIDEKKCEVHGIDFDKSMLKKALENGYKKTFLIDMNKNPDNLKTIREKYDTIICADILEHLIDPKSALNYLKNLLNKNGAIIISVPNVAFGLNRLNLLLGKWNYTEFGTLDKTHVRFFTKKTLRELVSDAGLTVNKLKPYNQFGILAKIYPFDQIFPEFLCYQLLIKASKNK